MENLLERITFDPNILGGKPIIRGLRVSVVMILELLAKGASQREILEDYPDLEPQGLEAALLYAHHLITNEDTALCLIIPYRQKLKRLTK